MTGLVTLGETMGLLRPDGVGSLAHAGSMVLGVGGAESNVAIGVARLGGEAHWIGRVGDDGIGRRVLREIRAEGVAVHPIVDDGARTGLMLKERVTANLTEVLYYRVGSAGSRLEPGDLDAALIADAAVLHVTGITLALSASAAAAVGEAVRVARAAGVLVSFDVNHRTSLWASPADAAAAYRAIVAHADLVFAGAEEAALLVESADAATMARAIAELGPHQVVVKRGADGVVAFVDGRLVEAHAVPVRVVDTVGAGDAFVAGYLAELLAGRSPEDGIRLGVQTGAFACLGAGDWESYPRRAELTLLDAGGDPVRR